MNAPDVPPAAAADNFPDAEGLAALRAWYAGMSVREAVEHYLPQRLGAGQSARGVLGELRRAVLSAARRAHRPDWVALLSHPASDRTGYAKAVGQMLSLLEHAKAPQPHIADDVAQWFSPRTARTLDACGIRTLADLTVRIPRRRQWWRAIAGLGATSARQIETFFAAHPALSERARALIAAAPAADIAPWEVLTLPHEVDGTTGAFRAPRATCTLDAQNDYDAVQTWIALHESAATQRAYRKEAERLILWAVVERCKPLSSLTTEDALAYRAFLRRPSPRQRWVGPGRNRRSPDWRPFAGNLSARSVGHALSILGALFRWLISQRYLLANPFAGVKVRGAARATALDVSRGFSHGEWTLIRTIADGLAWSYGWSVPAAARLRFLLDFGFATGLRASELVGLRLGQIETDARDEHWIHLIGKGQKPGKVALPPLAWQALTQYLLDRDLPVSRDLWHPDTPLVGRVEGGDVSGAAESISGVRLWVILKRFFVLVATQIEDERATLAAKLRKASPHWMRHTHATFALANGAELTTVRDNLRHASVSTTSLYLHTDDEARAAQMAKAFSGRS